MAVTPGATCTPAISLSATRITSWAISWNGVTNTELRDEFKLCTCTPAPTARIAGHACAARGGCAANAWHATGDIHGVYEYGCEVFRKRIKCALMIKVAESLDPELAGRAATAVLPPTRTVATVPPANNFLFPGCI